MAPLEIRDHGFVIERFQGLVVMFRALCERSGD